jgi:hypothetical protein
MIPYWKSLVVLLIGLAAFVGLGPRNDSGSPEVAQQVSAIAHGCGTQSGRCMVDIRYAYPAADLSVLVEEVYF